MTPTAYPCFRALDRAFRRADSGVQVPEAALDPPPRQNPRLDLGPCQLDLDSGLVLRGGAAVPMRARPLAVLRHLATRPGQIVSKTELIEAAWAGVAVSDDSLTQAIRDIRVQIGDDTGTILRTAARRGYMLVPGMAEAPPPPQDAPTDHRPRIGILPFADQTGSAESASLIALLNDETAAGLSRFRTFIVLSPRSVAAAASAEPDPVRLAATLKAIYLLFGTARPAPGGGFRLALELIDDKGALVWTDVFDCSGPALLDQPDAIPRRILGHLNASLEEDEIARVRYRPTGSLSALDHLAKGLALMRRADPALYPAAKAEFEAACADDPSFGMAHSQLSWAELSAGGFGLAPLEARLRARDHAQRGADLAPFEARTVSSLGYAQIFVREFDAAERNIFAAHRMNPFSAIIMMDMVVLAVSRGRPADALDWLARVAEVSPVPIGYEDILLLEAHFQLGQYDQAAAAVGRIAHPDLRQRTWAAAIAAMRGDIATVRRELEAVARMAPGWDPLANMRAGYDYEHEADMRRMLDAVDLALRMWRGTA